MTSKNYLSSTDFWNFVEENGGGKNRKIILSSWLRSTDQIISEIRAKTAVVEIQILRNKRYIDGP